MACACENLLFIINGLQKMAYGWLTDAGHCKLVLMRFVVDAVLSI